MTLNEQHYCPGENAETIEATVSYSYSSVAAAIQYTAEMSFALQTALASHLGQPFDPKAMKLEVDVPDTITATLFLTNATMNVTAMSSALFSTSLQDFQAVIDATLTSVGVPLDELLLEVTSISDPNAFGYGEYSRYFSGAKGDDEG